MAMLVVVFYMNPEEVKCVYEYDEEDIRVSCITGYGALTWKLSNTMFYV